MSVRPVEHRRDGEAISRKSGGLGFRLHGEQISIRLKKGRHYSITLNRRRSASGENVSECHRKLRASTPRFIFAVQSH